MIKYYYCLNCNKAFKKDTKPVSMRCPLCLSPTPVVGIEHPWAKQNIEELKQLKKQNKKINGEK